MKDKCIDLVIFGNNAKLGFGLPKNTIRDANFKKFYKSLPPRLGASEIAEFSRMIQGLILEKAALKESHRQKIHRLNAQIKR